MVHGYFGIYLKGYPGIADNFSSIARFSPLMNTLSEGSRFSSGNLLLYFVTSVILVALSIAMYKKRKLERATDSIVFKILEPVLAGLVTFFGMTVMGILAELMLFPFSMNRMDFTILLLLVYIRRILTKK